MKPVSTWRNPALFALAAILLTACGSDGGGRQLPNPNLNFDPVDARWVKPIATSFTPNNQGTLDFCPSDDLIISIPKNQDSCNGYVEVDSFIEVARKDLVGSQKLTLTRGIVRNSSGSDTSRCEVAFRPVSTSPGNRLQRGVQYVAQIVGSPTGGLATVIDSAEFTTVSTFEQAQSCGGSNFIAGNVAGIGGGSIPSMKPATWQNFGTYNDATSSWNWNANGIVRLGADVVREFVTGGVLGLTFTPGNTVIYVQMNDPVETWTVNGSINLIRITNFLSDGFQVQSGQGILGSGINLNQDCPPNSGFNPDFPNSCIAFDDATHTRLKIRLPGSGIPSGPYMLTFVPAMISAASGKNLKNAFVYVFNVN